MAGKLILVVDDEADIVEIVSDLLQGEGFSTACASDGQQALAAMATRRPDGVVLDIRMPVLDGVEVLRRMRGDQALARTPVVVLTASQLTQELTDRFREFSVFCWIAKPFEPDELMAAVKKAVAGAKHV